MANLAVATEIRNQLGGKALYMLGAQNVAGGENYLSFKIRGSKAFSHIKITLNSMDLYDITFYKFRGIDLKKEETVEGLYSDMIHKVIEEKTGLYTSL